ncbi:MAG TPA: hypothetical protein VKB03_00255 [Conexibacter sp.]|nr:hypothetical protein [Conexibacter sp.]
MSEALAHARRLPGVAHRVVAASGAGAPLPAPLVAILCTPSRGRVAASAIALALARVSRCACALAGTVGEDLSGSIGGTPSARRAARGVRDRGLSATASGRLVWLPDRRGAVVADDIAGRAAVMSAELGRAAAFAGVPAAIALPFARTAALDRVLAWHDAVIVVREPDTPTAVIERALTSLAELGRPVATMAPPLRLSGTLAAGGVVAPAEAMQAVAELELGLRPGPPDA